MPTVLRVDGFEVMIYLHDHAPAHVFHGKCEVQIWLGCEGRGPMLREQFRCTRAEARRALKVVGTHHATLCRMWKEIHDGL